MLRLNTLYNTIVLEYNFSLLFINIIIYIFLLSQLFSILFLFNLKYFKSLSELKGLKTYNFIYMLVILIILSLAGMPPLLGFVGKFLLVILLFFRHNYFLFLLFIFLNFFAIYFYIQNIRFLLKKDYSNLIIINNNYSYINMKLIKYIVLINFFNVFGIFYFEEFFILFNYWSSFLFLG